MSDRIRLAGAVLIAALAPGTPADAQVVLARGVQGSGGGTSANATHAVRGTAGQAVVGASAGRHSTVCHGWWCVGAGVVVSVDDPPDGARRPDALSFGVARPNPSRGPVTFDLALPADARIELDAFDVQGRSVGERLSRPMHAGWHALTWSPRGLGAGLYFVRLRVDGRAFALRRVARIL